MSAVKLLAFLGNIIGAEILLSNLDDVREPTLNLIKERLFQTKNSSEPSVKII
jgi:hypothetical protein